jgi:hypothetical protein
MNRFYVEEPNGRIRHRAEPLLLVLALLVIPALVLEEASLLPQSREPYPP